MPKAAIPGDTQDKIKFRSWKAWLLGASLILLALMLVPVVVLCIELVSYRASELRSSQNSTVGETWGKDDPELTDRELADWLQSMSAKQSPEAVTNSSR